MSTDFDKTVLPGIRDFTRSFTDTQVIYVDELEKTFLFRLQEFAPKRTGAYSRSWATIEKDFQHIKFETSMPDLYVILEFGTGPHEIRPKESRVLVFKDSAGNTVFTMKVNHPGTTPRPHVRTALDDTIRDAQDILLRIMMERYPWLKRA